MTRHGPLLRYGFAVLIYILGFWVMTIPMVRQGPGISPIIVFFMIMLSAWFGGLGPGLLQTLLIALPSFAMITPLWRTVRLVLFLIGGGLISAMMEALHIARRRAEESEERQRAFVAELQRSREALQEAKEAAEAANHAKDRFLAVLSHELRTPLTPVLATITHIEGLPGLPEELKDDVATIRRNVSLEARLIGDLLDIDRLARGEFKLAPEVIDAHDALKAALEICREAVEAKGVAVSLSLRAEEHHARADPARLQQVFWNLISNALKFTPEGGRVRLRSSNPAGGRIVVEVADTGIGIEPEFLPLIFNEFEQGERSPIRRHGGLGLGLSIARRLVELQGGTLDVSSDGKGAGATFTLEMATVPAPRLREAPTASPPKAEPVTEPEPEGEEEPKPLKLLLVEDNPDTLRAMTRLLKASGFAVQAAASVGAAFEATAGGRFDLVVSDIGLPDGSGLDVMRHVKDRYGIKGIAFSGYGSDEDVRASREAGFEHHLTKPVDLGTLVDLIRRTAS